MAHHVFGGIGTLEVVDWLVLGLAEGLAHRGLLDIIFIIALNCTKMHRSKDSNPTNS